MNQIVIETESDGRVTLDRVGGDPVLVMSSSDNESAHLIARSAFFLSGFAALLYQVIWQRMLVLFSGADVYSVTIIVAAYMAGLGLGALAGGRWADALGARASLVAFAVIEALIGGCGAAARWFYYDFLYAQTQLASDPRTAAVVLFLSLLVPTALMGMSLPLLARATTSSLSSVGRIVGSLYGWNTLGAAAGAFVTTWVLLPRLGLATALWCGAAVNLACAALACAIRVRPGPPAPERRVAEPRAPVAAGSLPFATWAALYACTGFLALALEIAWFRLLGVMLKSTAYTFGTLLSVYLTGIGIGAALAARRVDRSASAGRTFLLLQLGILAYVAVSTVALVILLEAGVPASLVQYISGYDPMLVTSDPIGRVVWFYGVIPLALVGPPTVLMGMSFPYLQRAVHHDMARLGERLGVLLAANIGGSVAGAALAGWVLLPRLGTAATLQVLVAAGAAVLLLVAWRTWRVRLAWIVTATTAAATAAALSFMPDGQRLWASLHGSAPRLMLFHEDGAGLSLLKADGASFAGPVRVFVNGLGQSWIPYGGVHTALGAIPALLHPAPHDVAMIGLGSGDTAFAALGRPEVQRLVVIEIIGVQRATLERLAVLQPYPGLVALLSDPRVAFHTGDGRAFLRRSPQRFDIIEADALRPTSAYAGNLYSREYFALLAARLKPGGLAVTWAPTDRIRRTFLSVFPYVLLADTIAIGSDAPIPDDVESVRQRAADARGYFAQAGVDIDRLLADFLHGRVRRFGPMDARDVRDVNTDLFPRDEFR